MNDPKKAHWERRAPPLRVHLQGPNGHARLPSPSHSEEVWGLPRRAALTARRGPLPGQWGAPAGPSGGGKRPALLGGLLLARPLRQTAPPPGMDPRMRRRVRAGGPTTVPVG